MSQQDLRLKIVQNTHLATRAKLQTPSTHVLLIEMDARTPRYSDSERYLCASSVLREGDIDPRPGKMTPSHKDDIFHAVDPTTKVRRHLEAGVNILEHPFTEITVSNCVLTFCQEWEVQ